MKVNKVLFLIILACLAFLIYGNYNQVYSFLFIGAVGACAGVICMLCEILIQVLRNPNLKK